MQNQKGVLKAGAIPRASSAKLMLSALVGAAAEVAGGTTAVRIGFAGMAMGTVKVC